MKFSDLMLNKVSSELAEKANRNDTVYLSDYIANYDKTSTIYNNCDSAFASAINDCKSGGVLVLPIGQIMVSGIININKPITILGSCGSNIIQTTVQSDLFNVNADQVKFIGVTIDNNCQGNSATYPSMKSGDYTGIRFISGRRHYIQNCTIRGFSTNVHFVSCDWFSITDSEISKAFNYGVLVENQAIPDSGDSVIQGNILRGSLYTTNECEAVICVKSGGGVKLTDNKIFTGKIGLLLSVASNCSTSDLIIANNSIEGQSVNCVKLTFDSGATNASWSNIQFVNNQILANNCTSYGFLLDGTQIPYCLKNIIISNNNFINGNTSHTCVEILGASYIVFSDNIISGGTYGVEIGSYVEGIQVFNNIMYGQTSAAINHGSYSDQYLTRKTNIKHVSTLEFSNSSKTVATYFSGFTYNGTTSSSASYILEFFIEGSINTTLNEKFHVYKKYLVTTTWDGANATTVYTLLSNFDNGLPINAQWDGNSFTICRGDTYADGTYTITGNIKVTVDGKPYKAVKDILLS